MANFGYSTTAGLQSLYVHKRKVKVVKALNVSTIENNVDE